MNEADYVIVGAGSAGCVLASRLSADGRYKVVVIEAGVDDRPTRHLTNPRQLISSINIHLPAGYTRILKDSRVNWNYTTEPDPGSNDRVHDVPRGRVLGGSSSINGMLWVRGLPEDYDGWRQLGNDGWAWNDVEAYFRRIEHQHGRDRKNNDTPGPLHIVDIPMQHPMLDVITRAFQEAGAPASDDLNGAIREGVAPVRMNASRGQRMSAAVAYLHPAMKRRNLSVVTGAHVSRILFEDRKAVGIEYQQDGVRKQIRARREVIVSSGAINSPQLLELSGIGDAQRLRDLGIEVLVDRSRVGENLQDHFSGIGGARMKPGTPGFNELSRGRRLVGQAIRYVYNRSGILAMAGANLTAFLKSDPALDLPDLQLFASPATVDIGALIKTGKMAMERDPGLTVGGYLVRPRSRGSIHIKSADFRDQPAIRPNFLADEADQRAHVSLLRWVRRIMHSPALAPYFDHELAPGADAESDEALLDFGRATGSTAYHQCGTCVMGVGGDAVVSPTLKVNGVESLRVVDASVMPNIVSGNTNAATMMIAEKASDMILAAAR